MLHTHMIQEEWCEEKNRRNRNFFEDMVINFFSNMFHITEKKIEIFVKKQGEKMRRGVIFILVFSLGLIYVLNAIALFVSEYMRVGNWAGYGSVGIALIILGLILKK